MKTILSTLKKIIRRPDGRLNPLALIVIAVAIFFLLQIAYVLTFFSFMVYDFKVNGPKAAQVQSQLETEFRAIKPLPQAVPSDYHASHKPGQSLVGSGYTTGLSYQEIRAYYDAELSKQGWKFNNEKPLRDWGRDLGGRSAHYCKGDFTASLEYAGEKANYGWTYALELSWGLDHDCDVASQSIAPHNNSFKWSAG